MSEKSPSPLFANDVRALIGVGAFVANMGLAACRIAATTLNP